MKPIHSLADYNAAIWTAIFAVLGSAVMVFAALFVVSFVWGAARTMVGKKKEPTP